MSNLYAREGRCCRSARANRSYAFRGTVACMYIDV
jgi:hypothetical protein